MNFDQNETIPKKFFFKKRHYQQKSVRDQFIAGVR